MLDLKFIRDNQESVKANVANRNVRADIDRIVALYDRRSELIQSAEALRNRRNENARAMKQKLAEDARVTLIQEGKQLKEEIAAAEAELALVESELHELDRKSVV